MRPTLTSSSLLKSLSDMCVDVTNFPDIAGKRRLIYHKIHRKRRLFNMDHLHQLSGTFSVAYRLADGNVRNSRNDYNIAAFRLPVPPYALSLYRRIPDLFCAVLRCRQPCRRSLFALRALCRALSCQCRACRYSHRIRASTPETAAAHRPCPGYVSQCFIIVSKSGLMLSPLWPDALFFILLSPSPTVSPSASFGS